MPRTARLKSYDSIYHIMVRSVGDIPLYKDDGDKDVFLGYVKKYMEVYLFKVYAYCIMDTHAHFLIDANGADVSRFMHCINQCYAQFYNKKYKRHGHVFADRFKSKIIDDEAYLLTVSGYIHNNPSDIPGFENRLYEYKYSSLGIYLGLQENKFNIVSGEFVLQHFGKNTRSARRAYGKFVLKCGNLDIKDILEFKQEPAEYRSERRILVRNFKVEEVVEFVSNYTKQNAEYIHIKGMHDIKRTRAISILLMRSLCGLSYREICGFMGNITQSHASSLSSEGLKIIRENDYKDIINDMIRTSKHLA